jgi:hypothetical protein
MMPLTSRPLLDQELGPLFLEAGIKYREQVTHLMEEGPQLKSDTEPIRSPKQKRPRLKAAPVVYRSAESPRETAA